MKGPIFVTGKQCKAMQLTGRESRMNTVSQFGSARSTYSKQTLSSQIHDMEDGAWVLMTESEGGHTWMYLSNKTFNYFFYKDDVKPQEGPACSQWTGFDSSR
jgi:hypothetical protein